MKIPYNKGRDRAPCPVRRAGPPARPVTEDRRRASVRASFPSAAAAFVCALLGSCAALSPIRLESEILGPTLLVVAGIHGDEPSGVEAARALAAGSPARRGRLLVLPEANPEARAAESRAAPGQGDLNRSFPGRRLGAPGERRAASLFRMIRTSRPDLVLDLHESDGTWAEGPGPFLVVPSLPRAAELALAMLNLPGMEGFSYTGGPPRGSLAAEISGRLAIPALVVEIPDSVPPSRRAQLHRAAVDAAMAVLGMMDTGEEGRIKPCR
ncbi:MAG: hypothetical protein GX430_08680 [Treponema sp.]|nr:hypothetical protein [Treponema sp.]